MTTIINDDELRELWLNIAGFPDLLLTGETIDLDGNQFTIEALADETTWGSPVPIDVSVQRWMTDGAVATTQGHENRQLTFKVAVSADTTAALAAGESALALRSNRMGVLKWISHEGAPDAPATVFEVWTMHLEHQFDDVDEFELTRTYGVQITAKPWVRSETLTVSVAPTSSATTTSQIDACTSTTGWTGSPGTVVTAGGAVSVSSGSMLAFAFTLTRTGTVSGLGALKYLLLDSGVTGATITSYKVKLDGQELTTAATLRTVRYFELPAGMTSFSTLSITALTTRPSGTVTFSVANVAASDGIAPISSPKQLTRRLEIGGSVKTSGSIQLASPSATALGTCLIYTTPDTGNGFSSAMSPYRTAGNTVTSDLSCVSGAREAFVNAGATAGAINYNLPAKLPEATYVVVGRFIFGSAATMTVTVASAVGANSGLYNAYVTATAAGPVWAVITTLPAPFVSIPPESAVFGQFQAAATASSGTHFLDELYLLDITHGSYSLLVGNPGTKLWVDSPDVDPSINRPSMYQGSLDNKGDAYTPPHTLIRSIGDHDLDPGGVTLFTVTDGVDNAAASASFYRRWHTNAGD